MVASRRDAGTALHLYCENYILGKEQVRYLQVATAREESWEKILHCSVYRCASHHSLSLSRFAPPRHLPLPSPFTTPPQTERPLPLGLN